MDGSTWILDHPPPQAAPRGGLLARLRRWRQRSRERKLLATLDHHMLADIGTTGIEQARECAKPFWRA